MKGLHPLIGMVLVIAITIAAIAIILEVALPATERTTEILLFDEIKDNLLMIDNKIIELSLQGEGSSSDVNLIINGGQYTVDADNDEIVVSMDSMHQIVGVGESYTEDGILIQGESGKVIFRKSYEKVDITDGAVFERGNWIINIRNQGFASGKQIISIIAS